MELWDIYDTDRKRTGRTIVRGEELAAGEYHLVVHICFFNHKGEMLIQQRQPFKSGWPGRWDLSVGGSAVSLDTSQTAAEREVKEELGLDIALQGIRPHFSFSFARGFDDYYLIEREIELSELTLQESEVQQVRWAPREEIKTLIETEEFIPYYPSLIDLLFDSYKQYGAHSSEKGK